MDEFSVQLVEVLATTLGVLAPLAGLALAAVVTCAWAKRPRPATSSAVIGRNDVCIVAASRVRLDTVRLSSRLLSRAPPGLRLGSIRLPILAADFPGLAIRMGLWGDGSTVQPA